MGGMGEHHLKCEVSQIQKAKDHMFSPICGIKDLINIQQYYEKPVMLRGGHLWEKEGKRWKLRR
jgi:hypothetical protein